MTTEQPTSQLVFVPWIGFRAAGTRTLTERAETFTHETRLTLLAVAAAPDRTDVVVEWERDPATCTADTQLVAALRYKEHAPLDWMTIALDTGPSEVKAIASERPAYSYGERMRAAQRIRFPPLAGDTVRSELRVSEGGQEWRVPFNLEPADPSARALSREVERDGVVVRATALARDEDELVVALEAEATRQIRQVGWPIPAPVAWSRDDVELRRLRTKEHRRFFTEHFGARVGPITLETDRGGRGEIGRLFSAEPQQSAPGEPFISRFSVIFEAPSVEASLAVLVVPFVALNDPEQAVTVDLRDVPVDVALGEYRFRVVRTEAHGKEQRKVVLEIPPSSASPRFVEPRRMQGADPDNVAWLSEPVDAESGPEAIWMATKIGDPPIVTFTGAVLRVDGPFRLELTLS